MKYGAKGVNVLTGVDQTMVLSTERVAAEVVLEPFRRKVFHSVGSKLFVLMSFSREVKS